MSLVFLAAGFELVCVFPLIKVDPPFDAGAPPFFLSFCLLLSNSDISVKNLVWCNLMIFGTGSWEDREGNDKRGTKPRLIMKQYYRLDLRILFR